jgi:hypothetical protein
MHQRTLKLLFGMTQVSRHLKVALETLYDTLKHDLPEARIQWPSHKEIQLWADMVSAWEPGLRGIFGMVDGLALTIQNPGNPAIQRAYYNGWKRSTLHCLVGLQCVTMVLVSVLSKCPTYSPLALKALCFMQQ